MGYKMPSIADWALYILALIFVSFALGSLGATRPLFLMPVGLGVCIFMIVVELHMRSQLERREGAR